MLRLGRYLGLKGVSFDAVFPWIMDLRSQIGIPNSLSEIDIDATRADEIGAMAVGDPTAASNPITFNAQQYTSIFKDAVNGSL